jgi:hypothetical protein
MIKTAYHAMSDTPLTFTDFGEEIPVAAREVGLLFEDDALRECRLTFVVAPEVYAQIDARELFNLAQEARGQLFGGQFEPDEPVEIEAGLHPELLSALTAACGREEASAVARYLHALAETEPESIFLNNEAWYGLYVKQNVPLPPELADEDAYLKVGYQTEWANNSPF